MENNTSEEIDDSIKPVFESNGSFISALVFLAVGAFGVTLFEPVHEISNNLTF